MCSIGGFISSRPLNRYTARNLLGALIWYGADRGTQSAGCYYGGKMAKRAMHPSAFVEHSDFFNLFGHDSTIGLTHTRMPTCGGLGDAQAQPFQIGQTVTVHNGMFWDTKALKKEWNLEKSSGVDSELITSLIRTLGPNKLPEFIESTDGPSAIAAVHNNKLYLMRAGNPTWFYHLTIEDGMKVLVFASTADQLERAMRHAWLISDPFRPNGTEQNILLQATPGKLMPIGKKITGPCWRTSFGYDGYHSIGEDELWRKYLGGEFDNATRRLAAAARGDKWEGE